MVDHEALPAHTAGEQPSRLPGTSHATCGHTREKGLSPAENVLFAATARMFCVIMNGLDTELTLTLVGIEEKTYTLKIIR